MCRIFQILIFTCGSQVISPRIFPIQNGHFLYKHHALILLKYDHFWHTFKYISPYKA